MQDIEYYKKEFLKYTEAFLHKETLGVHALDNQTNTRCLQLKITHTFHVLENTNAIINSLKDGKDGSPEHFTEHFTEEEKHIARLTALFHDIGRFEQFTQYKTFSDAKSVNHAMLGVKILKETNMLNRENKAVQAKVFFAILAHNRQELSKRIKKDFYIQCQIIRDADKLDILRIFGEHVKQALPEKETLLLNVQDKPDMWTDSVVKNIEHKQSVKYTDLKFVNDFKLLLGAWIYDLNFSISRQRVKEKKLLDPILCDLPKDERIQALVRQMYAYSAKQ